MRVRKWTIILIMAALAAGLPALFHPWEACAQNANDTMINRNAARMVDRGRQIFRFATFGDQAFWGRQLRLHDAIKGAALGGVGPGLTPAAALGLGLKVDVEALPPALIAQLQAGTVNLNDPAVTVELLRLNAVLGLTGFFDAQQNLISLGVQCAFCHSVVDDSLVPGIGRRLDGWANRDLNVGAIIGLAPNLQPLVRFLSAATPPEVADPTAAQVRAILNTWGPGKYDAAFLLDGKSTNPNTGGSSATLLPPIFGLAGVNLHTWTGWGAVSHWNAFVANLALQGRGTFFDPRLNDPAKFPIAAAFGFGNKRVVPDRSTVRLPALHVFQLAIPSPAPPAGSFDPTAAARGNLLFNGKAGCARCHVPPLYTEPGWNMHTPAEIGIDAFQADRSPDGRYRTAPLKGLWTHRRTGAAEPGPFYHDGRFATLLDVVNHYDSFFGLLLTPAEKVDLIQFLQSL